jgi:alkylated DNA repair protein alkB family protein 8
MIPLLFFTPEVAWQVRSGPCTCIFPEQCDSQQPHLSTLFPSNDDNVREPCTTTSEDAYNEISYCATLSCNSETENSSESSSKTVPSLVKPFNSVTPEIEKTYVHKVYDAIAPHFSATRFAKWPKVALFLNSLEAGSVIADAGCGNGKYLGLNPKCLFVGCDISPPLVEICTQQGHEALVADALHLPYRTGFCDAAISIAVLHHLSNEGRRVRAIEELLRVVHKKGKVLITVWAVEQEDKKLLSKWTPLTCKYMDEWVDDVGTKFKRNLSTSSLGSIKEGSNEDLKELTLEKDLVDTLSSPNPRTISQKLEFPSPENHVIEEGDSSEMMFQGQGSTKNLGSSANDTMCQVEQQEYFVPWHLPYHRAEVGGASAAAVASGLAKKDDTKRAVVYNRYYHCFVQGELER